MSHLPVSAGGTFLFHYYDHHRVFTCLQQLFYGLPTGHILLCLVKNGYLQKKTLTRSILRWEPLVNHRGFEPRTLWLKVKCSANWASGSLPLTQDAYLLYIIWISLSTLFCKTKDFFLRKRQFLDIYLIKEHSKSLFLGRLPLLYYCCRKFIYYAIIKLVLYVFFRNNQLRWFFVI